MTQDNKKDPVTGIETTGHKWDGIEELNTPAPRWWLMVFLVTVIWAIGYWVVYPAWPTLSGDGERGGTVGAKEWTQYTQLEESQKEIIQRKQAYLNRFEMASLEDISMTPDLFAFALAGGKSAFKDNCATCHGSGGAGAKGYPNLNDDDWIWGGSLAEIQTSIAYGIRSDHADTRYSEMPAFADILDRKDIITLADYVIAKQAQRPTSSLGGDLYAENCAICHGVDAAGIRDFGAPNLKDAIWFYGDSRDEIISQISNPKHGMMPAWEPRLDLNTIKQLTIYVHSLGGGE